jgi:hypothetical protein
VAQKVQALLIDDIDGSAARRISHYGTSAPPAGATWAIELSSEIRMIQVVAAQG